MLKHIVMWKLKPEALGQAREMKVRLEALREKIPQILELEVGLPVKPAEGQPDLVLVSLFQDEAALETYQKHPDHLPVVEFVKKIAAERRVVDYLTR